MAPMHAGWVKNKTQNFYHKFLFYVAHADHSELEFETMSNDAHEIVFVTLGPVYRNVCSQCRAANYLSICTLS